MSDNPRDYRSPPDLLHDRIILITGAGDGIGRTAALSFAEHGARTILLGPYPSENWKAVYDEIVAGGWPRPSIAVMDFATAQGDDYAQLADSMEQEFGRLDGLLHNAGILGNRSPIEHFEVSKWLEVMHVNLNTPFILTQTLLPLLQASDDASIVFTSSGVGRRGRAYWGAYAVSKFGIEGLSQVLADETSAQGRIRVNCINPGATRTAMRRAAYPGEDPETLPLPESLMGPYLYLIGPDSRGVTGQSIDCQ